jgi:hypothetical protein
MLQLCAVKATKRCYIGRFKWENKKVVTVTGLLITGLKAERWAS